MTPGAIIEKERGDRRGLYVCPHRQGKVVLSMTGKCPIFRARATASIASSSFSHWLPHRARVTIIATFATATATATRPNCQLTLHTSRQSPPTLRIRPAAAPPCQSQNKPPMALTRPPLRNLVQHLQSSTQYTTTGVTPFQS